MTDKVKLTKEITETEFNNGYWYADEIKALAKEIGIPDSNKLRKDELEDLIKFFLRTGKTKCSNRKNIHKSGIKDIEKGLKKSLQIKNYTSNKETKKYIISESLKLAPDLKIKSGAWYRLNRWRDEQISNNIKITYGDLIKHFIKLNQGDVKFQRISVGRYINFISDYLASEKDATREQAILEWKKLKELDIPKDYKSWKKYKDQEKIVSI